MENPIVIFLFGLAQGLIILLASNAVKGIKASNEKLNILNGTVKEIKIWVVGHDKQDDGRHVELKTDLSELWNQLNQIRKKENA